MNVSQLVQRLRQSPSFVLVDRRFIVAEATKVQEDACFEAIYSHYAAAEAWNVAPGAHAALTTIKDAGEVADVLVCSDVSSLTDPFFMWLLSSLGALLSAAHNVTHIFQLPGTCSSA